MSCESGRPPDLAPTPRLFDDERNRALDLSRPSGSFRDVSDVLLTPYASDNAAVKFLRLRAGEEIATRFGASAEIYHGLRGSGSTEQVGGDTVEWGRRDIFRPARAPLCSERSMNESFSECCKNELIVRRSILPKEALNEETSDNRTHLLCFWARANYGVG